MSDKKNVTVVGAGIVGIACALNLLRDGHAVTVIDRLPPGEGTSFGNAGVFASGAVVPVPTPGFLAKAPRMLLARDGPLYLRWRHLPRMVPWLTQYMRSSAPNRVEAIADALAVILGGSLEEHQRLAAGTDAAKWVVPAPYLYLYETRAHYARDCYGWNLRRARGVRWSELEGDALRAAEPAIAREFRFAAKLHDHGFALDPSLLVKALAAGFERLGGTLLRGEVRDIEMGADGPRRLVTDTGTLDIEQLVIATGVWSARFAGKLGHPVPLESERGYHVTVENPGVSLQGPVMSARGKFVATPMAGGLRLAGLVEFGGLEAPPSAAPVESLLRQAKRMFPALRTAAYTTWMGHRPSLPDSLPVIGPSPRFPSVYFAFGHQHIGLTSGPRTGRLIADLISGRKANVDLAPFRIDRF